MDVATLMGELEPLTHQERTKRLVDLGRRSKDDADARGLISAMLRADDAYVRACAVATVYGSRDGAVLVLAASDPARTVRQRALRAAPKLASDDDVERILEALTGAQSRTRLVLALRRKRRFTPIDRFVARRIDADDRASVDVAPLAGAETVRARIELVFERGGPVAWARLAKLHSTLVSEHLGRVLAEGKGSPIDPRLAWRLTAVAHVLARANADAGLALLAGLFDRGEEPGAMVPRRIVAETLKKKPAETFDAVRKRHLAGRSTARPGAMGVLRLDRFAHHLGAERLAWTIEHAPTILSEGKRGRRWFLRLSEQDRDAVIDAWLKKGYGTWGAFLLRHIAADGPRAKERRRAYEKWSIAARGTTGIVSIAMLEHLPDDLRIEEARRHLALPALATRPNERIAYAALLPFADAKAELDSFLGHPEGEVRGMADRLLLSSIERDRASLAAGLAFVRARKFEQDPVRMAMIGTLAKLPVVCFAKEHLADVGAIVQDALDAADLSYGTAASVEELVVRLFRVDGEWGAEWLVKLLKTRGSIGSGDLATGLLPPDVDRLAPAIASLAATWATKERSHGVLWLATTLGKRLSRVPALLDALERLSREQPFAGVSAGCLALLRREAPERFVRIAPELVASDPSYVLIADVATFLATKRQDLLGPFVADDPIIGRFATGRQHWVLDFQRGYGTWTSTLQRRHADAIVRILKDEERDVPTLRWAIGTLVKLAFAPRDALLPFAADPRPPVREIAIRALPWLDGGAGLSTLLACLGDDRARWAIYALRKAFADMARADVLAELRKAPMKKVTVAKEVIRLLGELGGADGYGELVSLERQADLHRDARIALLRALWDHLERPPTWDAFERAVDHPDWVVASKLADIPLGRLTGDSEARVGALLVRILSRKEPEARLDLLRRAAYLPIADRERVFFRALVERIGAERSDEATAAANAALVRMNAGEVSIIVDRVKELLPRRRHTLALLPSFNAGAYAPKYRQDVARGVLDALARDRLAVVHRIRFAGGLLDTKELASLLRDLAKERMLFADALTAACEQARRVARPDSLDRELGAADDPRLRRVALEALAHAAAAVNGWSSDRRERLTAYRADPDLLVASAAAYVFLPEE